MNQRVELATPEQCEIGENVYAPDGRVIVRPGYVGLGALGGKTLALTSPYYARSVSGTVAESNTTLDLSNVDGANNDYWAIGSTNLNLIQAVAVNITTANTASIASKAQYYNGTDWIGIHVAEINTTATGTVPTTHLGIITNTIFAFNPPTDWATTTLTGSVASGVQDLYWLRFGIYDGGNGVTSFSAGTALDWTGSSALGATDAVVGLFPIEYASTKKYINSIYNTTDSKIYNAQTNAPMYSRYYEEGNILGVVNSTEAASLAVVPQFDEAFLAYGHRVGRFEAYPVASVTGELATVETGDFAVGVGAPYGTNADGVQYIAQETAWPLANYMSFFKGRLWAAGLENDRFTVQWSAPQPYHKVWPSLSKEPLMEDDNSPITGMSPLGQHMIVFKQDSIWAMVDAGINDFGLQEFAPQRIVAGVGCVANSSIKQIRGNLIFQSEDGIYAFDGTPQIKKISSEIDLEFQKINKGLRKRCTAAHWRTENLYMLAVNYYGNVNQDAVFVYDYDNGAWWIWKNIDARQWVEDEGANDQERIYFGDSKGRVYQLGISKADWGTAITSTVRTHRFGYRDGSTHRARSVDLWCTNLTSSANIEIISNDDDTGTATSLSFLDSREKNWDDFTYDGATDSFTPERRRKARLDFREDGDWIQVEVTHNTKNQPFAMEAIDLGMKKLGRR